MIARFLRHWAEQQEGDADVGDEVLERDDDGLDSDGPPVSEASGVEDGAAGRAGEEVEIIRDERPTADGVEQLEPGTTDWDVTTAEQRLSAAHSAPAAADVSLGPARGGLHADGVSVNRPGHPWHLMEVFYLRKTMGVSEACGRLGAKLARPREATD